MQSHSLAAGEDGSTPLSCGPGLTGLVPDWCYRGFMMGTDVNGSAKTGYR
jgi:hypothetical protein